jgi:hypothetical protein
VLGGAWPGLPDLPILLRLLRRGAAPAPGRGAAFPPRGGHKLKHSIQKINRCNYNSIGTRNLARQHCDRHRLVSTIKLTDHGYPWGMELSALSSSQTATRSPKVLIPYEVREAISVASAARNAGKS